MAREYPRSRRVGDQIQRELAEVIRDELKDPRLGMVTVSGVDVSRDLAYAKVYFTVLGSEHGATETARVLNSAAAFLRRTLGHRMVIRSVPQLQFVHDESVERGARLSSLINEAVAADERKARGEGDGEPPSGPDGRSDTDD
jgi:ribosome-binding factor A